MSGLDKLMKQNEEKGKDKKRWAKVCERQDLDEMDEKLSISQITNKIKPHINRDKLYGITNIIRIEKDLLELGYKSITKTLNSEEIKSSNLKLVCDMMVIESFYKINSKKEIPELKEISKRLLAKMNKIRFAADYNYITGISELKQYSEIMMSIKDLNYRIQNLPTR